MILINNSMAMELKNYCTIITGIFFLIWTMVSYIYGSSDPETCVKDSFYMLNAYLNVIATEIIIQGCLLGFALQKYNADDGYFMFLREHRFLNLSNVLFNMCTIAWVAIELLINSTCHSESIFKVATGNIFIQMVYLAVLLWHTNNSVHDFLLDIQIWCGDQITRCKNGHILPR